MLAFYDLAYAFNQQVNYEGNVIAFSTITLTGSRISHSVKHCP